MDRVVSLYERVDRRLTLGTVQPELSIYALAAWETLIGLGLMAGRFLRATLLLLFVQMLGTLTPLVWRRLQVEAGRPVLELGA